MTKKAVIRKLEQQQLKNDVPSFRVGDTVSVHTRLIEGDKERIQIFTGTVIARKGCGVSETFSIHRVAYGEGMERVFILHSPRIAKIEVVREGDVRQAKLYYLRGTSGKKARVKSRLGGARKKIIDAVVQNTDFVEAVEVTENQEVETETTSKE